MYRESNMRKRYFRFSYRKSSSASQTFFHTKGLLTIFIERKKKQDSFFLSLFDQIKKATLGLLNHRQITDKKI